MCVSAFFPLSFTDIAAAFVLVSRFGLFVYAFLCLDWEVYSCLLVRFWRYFCIFVAFDVFITAQTNAILAQNPLKWDLSANFMCLFCLSSSHVLLDFSVRKSVFLLFPFHRPFFLLHYFHCCRYVCVSVCVCLSFSFENFRFTELPYQNIAALRDYTFIIHYLILYS